MNDSEDSSKLPMDPSTESASAPHHGRHARVPSNGEPAFPMDGEDAGASALSEGPSKRPRHARPDYVADFDDAPSASSGVPRTDLMTNAESAPARADNGFFSIDELASIDEVSAMGDSIVAALTDEFAIEEVPAPVVSPVRGNTDKHLRHGDRVTPVARETDVREDIGSQRTEMISQPASRPADSRSTVLPDGAQPSVVPDSEIAGDSTVALPPAREDDPSATAALEPVDARRPQSRPTRRVRLAIPWKKIMLAVAALLALSMVGGGVAFAWNRWYRYDDAQSIQGEWQMANAQRTMVIDGTQLKIADDVSYEYTIDSKEKTISYRFGEYEGKASYRFAMDRDVLIIDEKVGTDWLVALHLKADPVMSSGEVPDGVTKLVRLSDDVEAQPKSLDGEESGDEEASEPFFIEGYTDYTKTEKPKKSSKKSQDSNGTTSGDETDGNSANEKPTDSSNGDSQDDQEESADQKAAYVDKERGLSFYYDSSLVLYHDQYGNYYYDMYGKNPYELPIDSTGAVGADNDGGVAYDPNTAVQAY